MKRTLLTTILLLFFTLTKLNAQSYPYWDAVDPGGSSVGQFNTMGPIIATTNAVFAIRGSDHGNIICRWTKSGGWEELTGLTVDYYSGGDVHDLNMMTVHGHYLYAVGLFQLAGYTNAMNNSDLYYGMLQGDMPGVPNIPSNEVQIAKFDFNTGAWSPVGQDFTATNVWMPSTIAVDANNRIYVGFDITSMGQYDEEEDFTPSLLFAGTTLDVLDVSTNDGVSWQMVGGGLVVPDSYQPRNDVYISALCADGTNVYIGGDFTGTTSGIASTNIIM